MVNSVKIVIIGVVRVGAFRLLICGPGDPSNGVSVAQLVAFLPPKSFLFSLAVQLIILHFSFHYPSFCLSF